MGVLNGIRQMAGFGGISAMASMASAARRVPMTGRMAIGGAGIGGLYGATLGRDPGQSRLGGAFTGALGGAALGAGGYRYGGAAMRGGMRSTAAFGRLNSRMMGSRAGYSRGAVAQAFGMGAGRGAFRQMRQDAARSYGYIGRTMTKAYGRIKGLTST